MLLLNGVYKQRQRYAINNPTIECNSNGFFMFTKLVKHLLNVLLFVYQDNSGISGERCSLKNKVRLFECYWEFSMYCLGKWKHDLSGWTESYLLVPLLKTPCTKGMKWIMRRQCKTRKIVFMLSLQSCRYYLHEV